MLFPFITLAHIIDYHGEKLSVLDRDFTSLLNPVASLARAPPYRGSVSE